ncbi:MAG: quinone oxidoreductase family protein [Rhodanobacter sp.]
MMEQAANLGIAGITGWRAVFADGTVQGLTVLVWGAASGVGAVALQMAVRDGATVLAVVRKAEQQSTVLAMGAQEAFLADTPDLVEVLRAAAPHGVDRVADVDFGSHVETNAKVLAVGGVICAYYSAANHPPIPYWTLGFADATLRLLGSDDFAPAIKARAAVELTAALAEGKLVSSIGARVPLDDIVLAHERVESGAAGRTMLRL